VKVEGPSVPGLSRRFWNSPLPPKMGKVGDIL
jgi:hypothetical protein